MSPVELAAQAAADAAVDEQVRDLLTRVGDRVRKVREQRGLARRALSAMSGVSPRYLAQLEAGEGNISIGLLHRVAVALELPIESFVGADDPSAAGPGGLESLFMAADADTRARVMQLLSPVHAGGARAGRVCLVGLRGAGKSTLGRAAGKALDLRFVELNVEIEAQAGIPVSEIMALYGQEGYRKLEAFALERIVASHDRLILAVGGGIVAEPATYQTLLARFHTIWLKATPQEHMQRVRAQGDERPMAGNPAAMAQLRSILTSRELLYAQAEAQLDTSGQSPAASLAGLLALIQEQGFLR